MADSRPVAEKEEEATTTTTFSQEDQAEADRHSQKQLIVYRSLITWQHGSRALVTQEPSPANQTFA